MERGATVKLYFCHRRPLDQLGDGILDRLDLALAEAKGLPAAQFLQGAIGGEHELTVGRVFEDTVRPSFLVIEANGDADRSLVSTA